MIDKQCCLAMPKTPLTLKERSGGLGNDTDKDKPVKHMSFRIS